MDMMINYENTELTCLIVKVKMNYMLFGIETFTNNDMKKKPYLQNVYISFNVNNLLIHSVKLSYSTFYTPILRCCNAMYFD